MDCASIAWRQSTVDRVVRLLRRCNVCIFLYQHASGTGVYHMTRAHRNVALVRVTSRAKVCDTPVEGPWVCVATTVDRSFCLSYSQFSFPTGPETCDAFMTRLKCALYPSSSLLPVSRAASGGGGVESPEPKGLRTLKRRPSLPREGVVLPGSGGAERHPRLVADAPCADPSLLECVAVKVGP